MIIAMKLLKTIWYLIFRKQWVTYKVKANNHYSGFVGKFPDKLIPFGKDLLKFHVKADKSWNNLPFGARSKVYGFTEGLIHSNSARVTVHPIGSNTFMMGAYCYVNGVSPQIHKTQKGDLITANTGDELEFVIQRSEFNGNQFYVFIACNLTQNSHIIKTWRCVANIKDKDVGSICFPYVGGTETSDKDILFKIREYGPEDS